MLSITENPPIMPEYAPTIDAARGKWWVGHTKSRFEKTFAWDLVENQIAYFLPMSPRTIFSGGRKRQGMMPLFPSYVFFCGDENACWQALRTNRLCNVLPVAQQDSLVQELRQIHLLLSSGQALEPHPSMPLGTRCRVKSGPLKDVVGTVIERGKETRFVLKVTMLGQGTSLFIEGDLLEPLEDPAEIRTGIHQSAWRESGSRLRRPA